MKQDQFVEQSVSKALQDKGYGAMQVQQGVEAAVKHYRQNSNFKPNVFEACTKYAVRSIGKPQK